MPPAASRAPRAPRKPTGDAHAARTQLATADQDARVAKDKRASLEREWGTAPMRDRDFLLHKVPSVMALMEWTASTGTDSLVAAFRVMEAMVHPDDWADFKVFCREKDVDAKELGDFINAAMEVIAGRPTVASSGS